MNKQILIDGSNAWYRAHCMASSRQLDNPGAGVVIMTYMLRRICQEFGKNNTIVCWDGGHGGRKEIDPGYKAKREAVPGVWEDLPYMKKMASCLGLKQAGYQGYEADDVVGSLAQSELETIIVSYDKDFYQLVNNTTRVLRPARTVRGKEIPRQVITEMEVVNEFGVLPNKLILVKTFMGDKSDNIPKLPVRFTKKFKEIFYKKIKESKSLEDFYSKIDNFDEKYRATIHDFQTRAFLNKKLLEIKTNLKVDIVESSLNAAIFKRLCDEMEINRLKIADWEAMPEEAAPPAPVQRGLF